MKRLRNEQGFLLLVVYIVVICVSIFSVAFFTRHHLACQATERYQNRILAFNAAEAGIDLALATLATTPSWTGAGYTPFNSTSIKSGFLVTVTKPDPTNKPNLRKIEAIGYSPDNTTTLNPHQTATITVYAQSEPQSLFKYAVFAGTSMTLSGNVRINSYNSTVNGGVYSETLNSGSNDTIGTNSTASKAITISGSSTVKGNAIIGPTGNLSTAIYLSGVSTISGTKTAATTAETYQTLTTTVPVSPDPKVSGITTLTLPAGTYHYAKLTVSGSGKICATGKVDIYVDGAVSLSGAGIVTQNNLPPNMTIYATGSGKVTISGSAGYYGSIYAPNSAVTNSGDVKIYGAIISKTMTLSGSSEIHYDEALSSGSGSPGSKFSVTTWQELNSLAWGTTSG